MQKEYPTDTDTHGNTKGELLRELQLMSHSRRLNCKMEDKIQCWQV